MQVNLPASIYGELSWMLPEHICKWLLSIGIRPADCHYVGSTSSGNGYTNGEPNTEYMYSIDIKNKEDATAFKIQFPDCKVFTFFTFI